MAVLHPRLIVAGAALVLAFAAGWAVQGWRMQSKLQQVKTLHAETLKTISDKTAAAQDAVRKFEQTTAKALSELDAEKTQEVTNAKLESANLRRCIAAGTYGVRLISTAGAASSRGAADAAAPGVDNEAAALHGDLQQRVLDLRDAIAEDSAALEYLQEYAKQCLIGAQAIQQ